MVGEEKLQLEICLPTSFEMLLEVTNNKLSGIFGHYAVPYLQIIEHAFNASVVIQEDNPGLGKPIGRSEMYDGCLGRLQRGEADVVANAIDYPLDIVNVSQGFIAFDEQISFTGFFPRPESVNKADFSRSLNSFHWSVYLLILTCLITFGIILKLRNQLKKKKLRAMAAAKTKLLSSSVVDKRIKEKLECEPGFFDVLRNFARTHFLERKSFLLAILILFLNFFSFFIFAHFNSLLNTDLVIPGQALIYEDYDQIMKAGVKPLFFADTSYYGDLKFAQNGSKGKQFWDWAANKFGEDNLFAPINVDTVGNQLPKLMEGKTLLFVGNTIALTVRSSICELYDRKFERAVFLLKQFHPAKFDWPKYRELQVYTRKDDSAINKIKSLILGKRIIESPKLFSQANQLFLHFFEHGHFQANIKMLARSQLASDVPGFKSILGPVAPERTQVKQLCKESNLPVPKIPNINSVTLSHFRFSFTLCAGLIICSFSLFLLELLVRI